MRDQLLRKEKDEASLCRVCEAGFPECFHSPILRGVKAFVLLRRRENRLREITRRYAFKPRSGLSTNNRSLSYSADTIERSAMKKLPLMLAFASLSLVPFATRAQFASAVISYDRGTGFAANFTNSNAALGAPVSSSGVTPLAPPFSTSQLVSIGATGSLTLQLSTPVINNPANPSELTC